MEDLVSQFSTTFTEFTTNVKLEDNRVSSHSSRLHIIEDKLFDIDCRVIECEQYPRRENIVISGIPNSVRHDELKETIVDICNQIGANITQYDIAACHRLPNGRSRWPANTIVRFYSRDHAELCLTNREWVKSFHFRNTMKMNLRIFENLSPRNNECLRIAKWLQNENLISSYFLRNGFVKVVFQRVRILSRFATQLNYVKSFLVLRFHSYINFYLYFSCLKIEKCFVDPRLYL